MISMEGRFRGGRAHLKCGSAPLRVSPNPSGLWSEHRMHHSTPASNGLPGERAGQKPAVPVAGAMWGLWGRKGSGGQVRIPQATSEGGDRGRGLSPFSHPLKALDAQDSCTCRQSPYLGFFAYPLEKVH
ncbi:hypothetical protein HYR99_14910 [Candidatus Poribacteria bacterium]|nr:hypothetical protein [Candidatus Poribacteria bacterium]